MRRRTTVLLACLLLAPVGCSSSGSDSAGAKPSAVTKTVTASPSLSRDETKTQCADAVAEAAPGWDDWNYSPGEWADDPRTPPVCLGLVDEADPTQGNRDFMGALLDGLDRADDPRASQ
ncbi:hypothetical protein [Streptomyces sp. NPDC057257]|uniref:hypothetical protein n=1 Tax=Streptomyces sp. NPDC057257 TaxID=3346071 RepID=UPI00363BE3F7